MIGAVALLGVLAYLVVFEVGLSAGRIHSGVTVNGIDVGGLTHQEAEDLLKARGKDMREEPLVFVAEGVDCRFRRNKDEVGWGPQPFDTAEEAMRVGRADAPFGALWDRLRAWFGGVTVDWADAPDQAKVEQIVDDCMEKADQLGLTVVIDPDAFEQAIVDAVLEWPPEQIHQIPIGTG